MDCKKEETTRVKKPKEEKMNVGAHKFVTKAQDQEPDHAAKKRTKSVDEFSAMAENFNDYLPVLRSETIQESLTRAEQKISEIKAITNQWKNVPDYLKTIEETMVAKLRSLQTIDNQQRHMSQELQAKIASIAEIESLQKQIDDLKVRKLTLTLTPSDLAKKHEETRQKLEARQEQNLEDKEKLGDVMKQVKERKGELESTRNQLDSVNRDLDKMKRRNKDLDREVRSMEDKVYNMEQDEKLVKKRIKDAKIKRNQIQKDINAARIHREQTQMEIDDVVKEIDQVTNSLYHINRRF